MSSIFSKLSNQLSQLNLLGGGQTAMPAGFVGPQQLPVQGPPMPTLSQQIGEQIGSSYKKISDQPGFNNALFRLGTTLMAARENGMGLGEGLLAGQKAFNAETDRAKAEQAAKSAAALDQLKFQTDTAFKLNNANLEKQRFGFDQNKYKSDLALDYYKSDQDKNKPQSPEARLAADFKAGLIDEDTYKRAIAKQIAPTEKTYKQFQLQAASFADRMTKAEGILQPFENNGTPLVNNTASALGKIPILGDYLQNATLSKDQQQYTNAASEWIRAKLRKESGAAIGETEREQEYRTYFPVPGDSPEVIKQKVLLRKNNTSSMIKQASGAYEDQYLGDAPGQTTSEVPGQTANKVLIYDSKGNLVK